GFQGAGLGAALSFAGSEWNIVGIFDAGNTGYSSKIWGDADQLMQAFRRETYSSLLFRVRDVRLIPDLKKRLESDPMLTVEVLAEKEYYRKQSEMMATFLRILGFSLTIIFSIGAIVGAMITMYAAVANRIGEIGILRSIGFQRKTILGAFLLESLFLGGIGGAVGLGFASLLSFLTVSTTNFQTFSELSFRFTLSYEIVLQSLAFALCMGLFGGVLPAFRAARMNIVSALREG
ncbi:MAG: ABC transporter permease, partial [Desulfovibrionales bacterium]